MKRTFDGGHHQLICVVVIGREVHAGIDAERDEKGDEQDGGRGLLVSIEQCAHKRLHVPHFAH